MRTTTFLSTHLLIVSSIFLALLLAYSNTFTAAWHFDDGPNILENSGVHLQSLDAESVSQAFWAHPKNAERVFRPIAYLSFALNWYLGADQVLGYHVVNLLLHWANAVLLYLVILQLLPLVFTEQRQQKQQLLIAAFAVLLWALNPLQTQAVTYIVQRMAMLATFFFLTALLAYLMARKTKSKSAQYCGFFLSLLCFLLALGSKENAITLPISLLLIEWIFFRSLGVITKKHLIGAAIFCCFCVFAVFLVTKGSSLSSLLDYSGRNFTLTERVLTESRIVVLYLSLLFFPRALAPVLRS